ncbi:maleylpyruvate isomerase N-terminal domain-containing protein [Tenggerimyces flavus]|uniref:Maleylpyruvate isomerase N-terminal domain-containing protein n=1 Tax=Tenggerimyces flavus TaxID=1708749 RepID=A0ABV7Y8Q7_9ACTN|nr:maleylpyruvate isomerase N-terminal domain-containing protein [Tenggerimyces flavus]MBM7791092.1 uncharacterized protein (TIGR03083 family) [Tenggerimyces flavus]
MNVLVAFRAEAEALDSALAGLTIADLARPTNCPPWNVKELLVHIAGGLPPTGVLRATSREPQLDTVSNYQRPERATTAYHDDNVRRTQAGAATIVADDVKEMLTQRWQAALADWSDRPDGPVEGHMGVILLSDFVLTRVIAHAAHGLDLAISLDLPPWTTNEALAVMRPVWIALLGADPSWPDARLFSCATGRTPLTDAERTQLGPLAATFPLLS